MNVVGSRLKQWRLNGQVTQDQLCAAIAHITEGSWIPTRHDMYRIEAGTRTVSDAELIALAAGLGCSIVWLLSGSEIQPSITELAAKIFHDARPASELSDRDSENTTQDS